jgi:hypothetical protein
VSDPISVRARFERFPATVKGAFILRGEDANPHQVVVGSARVAALGAGGSSPVPMAPVTLDVVPHRDVFVPFELPLSELEPGWYTLVCDVDVDGSPATYDGGRRFSVPWPRATVRRGAVKVGRHVKLEGTTVHVEQVDCAGDSIKVHLRVEPAAEVTLKLFADGRRLQVLELELDEGDRTRQGDGIPPAADRPGAARRAQGARQGFGGGGRHPAAVTRGVGSAG